MDTIKDNLKELYNIEYLKNKIIEELETYTETHNKTNLEDCTQKFYAAALTHAGKTIFIKDFFILDKNKNIYNLVLIDLLCDFYIYLCNLYNKISSVYEFSMLLNIRYNVLNNWKQYTNNNIFDIYDVSIIDHLYNLYYNNEFDTYINILTMLYDDTLINNNNDSINNNIYNIDNTNNSNNNINVYNDSMYNNSNYSCSEILNSLKFAIFSKLHCDREYSLTNKLIYNTNAIGAITAVNREYRWNIAELQQAQQIKALTVNDLPKLDTL